MRIYGNQLKQHLQRGLSPVYLLFGDEPLQKIEALDAIRQTAKTQGFDERLSLTVDNQFDWYQLTDAFNSLSLFSSRKLIELEIDKGKPGQQGSKALTGLQDLFNPDTVLLIHGGKIGADVQKAKWFKTLLAQGLFIPIYAIEGEQFERWVSQRCQQAQVKLDDQGIRLLASYYTGNLLAAAQEIDKLAIGYANQPISVEFLQSVILNQSRFNVFQLVDELLGGNSQQALTILASLQNEALEANIISWAITRETLQLYHMKSLIDSGMAITGVLQQFKVWKNRQALITSALQRLTLQQLVDLLSDLSTLDNKLKSFNQRQAFIDLCHICLSFQYHQQLSIYSLSRSIDE